MSLVERSPDASLDASSGAQAAPISGNLYAGEDLDRVSVCRIDSDGKVYMSNGSADDPNAKVHGIVNRPANQGEPVTLYPPDTRFGYSEGNLTPGQALFLATTSGRLDDSSTTGGQNPIAHAVGESDIVFAAKNL